LLIEQALKFKFARGLRGAMCNNKKGTPSRNVQLKRKGRSHKYYLIVGQNLRGIIIVQFVKLDYVFY
jgi:hypothetical protein